MKLLQINKEDSAWLKRWLRSNLSFFGVVVLLLVALKFEPEMPVSRLSANDSVAENMEELPPETEKVLLSSRDPNPVLPQGWRRTRDGWEDVSTWTKTGKNINDLIAEQKSQEPAWIRIVFSKIRAISPLMIALMQVSVVATIVNVARSRKEES